MWIMLLLLLEGYLQWLYFVKEEDVPVDWDLESGSEFLNYMYPALPSVKFQLLCVRMLGQLVLHGMWFDAVFFKYHKTSTC